MLTNQDKKFIEKVVETGNLTKSAQEAYKIQNYGYARVKGSEQITKPNIRNAIMSIADQVPDDKLVRVLNEGLEAENNEKPDFNVRHKYLDTALKIKGAYEPEGNKNIILNQVLVQFLDKKDDNKQ